jgi:hypothetical protein
MYRWELDDAAQPVFDTLTPEIRATLTAFMDAVVIVDPVEYQRESADTANQSKLLRTLHFGQHSEGLVTFLVYPPDNLALVVRIQWSGE